MNKESRAIDGRNCPEQTILAISRQTPLNLYSFSCSLVVKHSGMVISFHFIKCFTVYTIRIWQCVMWKMLVVIKN